VNFLQKVHNALISGRMSKTNFQLAGYIKTEYNTNMSQTEIYEQLKSKGYNEVIAKLIR